MFDEVFGTHANACLPRNRRRRQARKPRRARQSDAPPPFLNVAFFLAEGLAELVSRRLDLIGEGFGASL
jgi:hypothetical protein